MVGSIKESQWIFAHRGLWLNSAAQNTPVSLADAFLAGFSVETDIRDFKGKLVISHDPIMSEIELVELSLTENRRFALNIKEDGLLPHFSRNFQNLVNSKSFLFDGSIPQMYGIWKLGIPHALRISEFEKEVPWLCEYLWVDGFESDWWQQKKEISSFMGNYHCVFVSPELHGRNHKRAFDWFAEKKRENIFEFSVCTDFPLELRSLCNE